MPSLLKAWKKSIRQLRLKVYLSVISTKITKPSKQQVRNWERLVGYRFALPNEYIWELRHVLEMAVVDQLLMLISYTDALVLKDSAILKQQPRKIYQFCGSLFIAILGAEKVYSSVIGTVPRKHREVVCDYFVPENSTLCRLKSWW